MTYEAIREMLEEMELPVAYHHFAQGQSPDSPFCVFYATGADAFYAENTTYFLTHEITVELYTDKKEPPLERKLEAILTRHGLAFQKYESWLEDEKLYVLQYMMEG